MGAEGDMNNREIAREIFDEAVRSFVASVENDFLIEAEQRLDDACGRMEQVNKVLYVAGPERFPVGCPAPRLQLRWVNIDDGQYTFECHYELVFSLRKYDIRNPDGIGPGYCVAELGFTRTSERISDHLNSENPSNAVPFRDSVHALYDAKLLGGLPIYVIAPNGRFAIYNPKP